MVFDRKAINSLLRATAVDDFGNVIGRVVGVDVISDETKVTIGRDFIHRHRLSNRVIERERAEKAARTKKMKYKFKAEFSDDFEFGHVTIAVDDHVVNLKLPLQADLQDKNGQLNQINFKRQRTEFRRDLFGRWHMDTDVFSDGVLFNSSMLSSGQMLSLLSFLIASGQSSEALLKEQKNLMDGFPLNPLAR